MPASALAFGEGGHRLELFIQLHGQTLTADGQHLQGVLVHAQLGIGNLHATHQLFQFIGQGVDFLVEPSRPAHIELTAVNFLADVDRMSHGDVEDLVAEEELPHAIGVLRRRIALSRVTGLVERIKILDQESAGSGNGFSFLAIEVV